MTRSFETMPLPMVRVCVCVAGGRRRAAAAGRGVSLCGNWLFPPPPGLAGLGFRGRALRWVRAGARLGSTPSFVSGAALRELGLVFWLLLKCPGGAATAFVVRRRRRGATLCGSAFAFGCKYTASRPKGKIPTQSEEIQRERSATESLVTRWRSEKDTS